MNESCLLGNLAFISFIRDRSNVFEPTSWYNSSNGALMYTKYASGHEQHQCFMQIMLN